MAGPVPAMHPRPHLFSQLSCVITGGAAAISTSTTGKKILQGHGRP